MDSSGTYDWSWFWRGFRNLFSLPSLILISAFVGFGGLAREAGLPLAQLVFIVPAIWALPSHLILVAGILTDAPFVSHCSRSGSCRHSNDAHDHGTYSGDKSARFQNLGTSCLYPTWLPSLPGFTRFKKLLKFHEEADCRILLGLPRS